MKAFIYNQEDGTAAVCFPTGELSFEEMRGRDFPEDAVMVDEKDLPTKDKDFFEAWEVVDGKIEINTKKASDVAKNKIRELREDKFVKADQEMLIAIEGGEPLINIAAKKKLLRDFPERVDKAATLTAMRALIRSFDSV